MRARPASASFQGPSTSVSPVAAAAKRPVSPAASRLTADRLRVASPSASGRSASVRSTATTAAGSSKTSFVLQQAMRNTDKELQKHLQSLLHLKNGLRRGHDALGKEYTSVAHAQKDALACCGQLEDDMNRTREAYETTGTAESFIQRHALMVHAHLAAIQALAEEARQSLSAVALCDRELQHLMVLVDRATDIDMQCLDQAIPDAVITNGSPLFPHLSINDTDTVVEKASALCSNAHRIAAAVRRSIANATAEVSHSAHQFEQSLQTAARAHAEAAQGASRQLEGIRYEQGRLQRQKATLLEESEAVDARLNQVMRTISLREAAKDAIFSKSGVDPVVGVLRNEAKELSTRRDELDSRLRVINDNIAKSNAELNQRSDSQALSAHRTESYTLASSNRAAAGGGFSRRPSAMNSQAASPHASFVRAGGGATAASSRSQSPNAAAALRRPPTPSTPHSTIVPQRMTPR
jgi:hypothetical protein